MSWRATPLVASRARRFPARSRARLLPLAAILMIGCDSPRASVETPTPAAAAPTIVHQGGGAAFLRLPAAVLRDLRVTTVQEMDLPGMLETTGQISFDDRRVANIISRVAGRIEDVHVSQWDYVRRGEPILTLYSPDFMTAEAEYLQARASMGALAGGDPANVQFARSMVDAARRKLDLLGIEPAQIDAIRSAAPSFVMRAPISGTVVQNLATRGAAVNPGDVLYAVGTLDEVWITADIYEDELARVAVGQPLEAVTTAYPDAIFHGRVERLSPAIDPTTHTLQVRCAVANPDGKLKPQMLARVTITVRPGQALVAPREALVFDTNAYFAYIEVGGGSIERRKVTLGAWSKPDFARVVSGLKSGDRIVTGQALQVDELWHEARGDDS